MRARGRKPNPALATIASSSRNSSPIRATSKFRCWATNTAMLLYLGERECSIQRRNQKVIEEAPSAAVGRKDPRQNGRTGGRARQSRGLRQRRYRRVRRRPGSKLLFPGNEHAPSGRASGDGADHRYRSCRADDPRGRRRAAVVQAERSEARRLGGRKPHLCGGSVS